MIADCDMFLLLSLHAVHTSDLENNIEVLKEWMPLFFFLDKTKNAKWTSVPLHDLQVLRENHLEDYKNLSILTSNDHNDSSLQPDRFGDGTPVWVRGPHSEGSKELYPPYA
ncbi:hypothetical protein ElyMa_004775600 [Elysia marginata]|uniref:Uncharacterized protein n=1 Tax=Elysia marginata TaxID=1093978 RepID=A0AAV4IK83_9GAST|nr:hypothetical protein ElyMa_004775600 [Elysia marginata]